MTRADWLHVVALAVPVSVVCGLIGCALPLLYAARKLKTL